jgi:hypothetical protein
VLDDAEEDGTSVHRGSSEENLRGTAESYREPLVSYAAERDIGWTAWWWHPATDVSLLASWERYQSTVLGELVMDSLAGRVGVPSGGLLSVLWSRALSMFHSG